MIKGILQNFIDPYDKIYHLIAQKIIETIVTDQKRQREKIILLQILEESSYFQNCIFFINFIVVNACSMLSYEKKLPPIFKIFEEIFANVKNIFNYEISEKSLLSGFEMVTEMLYKLRSHIDKEITKKLILRIVEAYRKNGLNNAMILKIMQVVMEFGSEEAQIESLELINKHIEHEFNIILMPCEQLIGVILKETPRKNGNEFWLQAIKILLKIFKANSGFLKEVLNQENKVKVLTEVINIFVDYCEINERKAETQNISHELFFLYFEFFEKILYFNELKEMNQMKSFFQKLVKLIEYDYLTEKLEKKISSKILSVFSHMNSM